MKRVARLCSMTLPAIGDTITYHHVRLYHQVTLSLSTNTYAKINNTKTTSHIIHILQIFQVNLLGSTNPSRWCTDKKPQQHHHVNTTISDTKRVPRCGEDVHRSTSACRSTMYKKIDRDRKDISKNVQKEKDHDAKDHHQAKVKSRQVDDDPGVVASVLEDVQKMFKDAKP